MLILNEVSHLLILYTKIGDRFYEFIRKCCSRKLGGIVKSKEKEYNEWHSKEHMPERISLPGFLRGLRAVGIHGTDLNHKYFMMYELSKKKYLYHKISWKIK